MSGWYVWTNRDTGSAGWSRVEAESSPTDLGLEEQLKPLATSGFIQLEHVDASSLNSTEGIPIVSAVWHQQLNRWLFVLRGIGGTFGAAGTTQVCAAPEGTAFAAAWQLFWAAVSPEQHRVQHDQLRSTSAGLARMDFAPDRLRRSLLLLAEGATVAIVPAEAAEARDLLGAMARFVPESAARGTCWSTCHVASSVSSRDRIITGRWPESLVEAWPKAWRWLYASGRTVTEADVSNPGLTAPAALDWLLDDGPEARAVLAASQAPTLAEVLAEAERARPYTLHDFELLAQKPGLTDADVAKVMARPELIGEFVQTSPGLALKMHAATPAATQLYGRLALELIWNSSAEGKTLLRTLLDEALSGRRDLTQAVRPYLQPGDNAKLAHLVLAPDVRDERRLRMAQRWVKELGVDPSQAPQLFVFDPAEVARLAKTDPVQAVRRIKGQSQSNTSLRRVLAELEISDPALAALLAAAPTGTVDPKSIESFLPERTSHPSTKAVFTLIRNLDQAIRASNVHAAQRGVIAAGIARWVTGQRAELSAQLSIALLTLATGFDAQYLGLPPASTGKVPKRRRSRKGDGDRRGARDDDDSSLNHRRSDFLRRFAPPRWMVLALVCIVVVVVIVVLYVFHSIGLGL